MRVEAEGVEMAAAALGNEFAEVVSLLARCDGRIILSGIGKSGLVARKIAATLNSTGSPAAYLHPIDALHGDIGMIGHGDVLLLLSKSGANPELLGLVSSTRPLAIPVVVMTGEGESPLARAATAVIRLVMGPEACPHDLAPTTSTTVMLAVGDAIAVLLLEIKGFDVDDFARNHPAGALGRKLTMTVDEIMTTGEALPIVAPTTAFSDVLVEMSRKRLGAALVVREGKLIGIITDGDIRRALERQADPRLLDAVTMMTSAPMTAPPTMKAAAALIMIEERKRAHLPIVDDDRSLLGIVHLHDLVERGVR